MTRLYIETKFKETTQKYNASIFIDDLVSMNNPILKYELKKNIEIVQGDADVLLNTASVFMLNKPQPNLKGTTWVETKGTCSPRFLINKSLYDLLLRHNHLLSIVNSGRNIATISSNNETLYQEIELLMNNCGGSNDDVGYNTYDNYEIVRTVLDNLHTYFNNVIIPSNIEYTHTEYGASKYHQNTLSITYNVESIQGRQICSLLANTDILFTILINETIIHIKLDDSLHYTMAYLQLIGLFDGYRITKVKLLGNVDEIVKQLVSDV